MTLDGWLREADAGSRRRGEAYAAEGRVRVVRRAPDQVVAVVEGTESYDVQVSTDDAFCTCPIGQRGEVCKHVVATVLAADSGPSGGDPSRSPVVEDIPPQRSRTDRRHLTREQMRELVACLSTRGYLDYDRALDHGRLAHEVVDDLERGLDERSADVMRPLLERAIGTMIRTILRSDDSSGSQGDATWRLLQLHVQAARLGSPDPLRLARWMTKVGFGDDGFFEVDPVPYADALGDRGLAAYRREIDRRLADDPDDFHARRARQRLAVLTGDVGTIVLEVGGPLDRPNHYLDLVDALLEVGAEDEALGFAREGAALPNVPHQTGKLYDVAVRLLTERGDHADAVALRMQQVRGHPVLSTYTTLRRTAGDSADWPTLRLEALDILLRADPEDWLRALLADGDAELAWEASTTMQVSASLLQQLVRSRARTHPADVFDGYVELIDATLVEARPENYREAVKLLGELRRACAAGGRVDEYDAYVTALLDRHVRRPTLVRMLRAMPPGSAG
ncbi:MAG TPA: SWIM zinc finger family protein [Nocardioidaceae bacterium]